MQKLRISEVFESIQGEGSYAGVPALFVRLSGCNKNCPWCDTKYHKDGEEWSIPRLAKRIMKSKARVVVWTGGEPMLQARLVKRVVKKTSRRFVPGGKWHHLETNGTITDPKKYEYFDYIAVSPKERRELLEWAYNAGTWLARHGIPFDIKIVTDLESVGMDMLDHATMLMPLTTGEEEKDKETRKKVWEYCVEHGKRYSPRLHVEVWGGERAK